MTTELEFAATILGPMLPDGKLQYMMKDRERFEMLRAWCPDSNMLCCEPFCDLHANLNNISFNQYAEAADLLIVSESCLESVANPIVRKSMGLYRATKSRSAELSSGLKFLLEECHRHAASILCGLAEYHPTELASLGPETLTEKDAEVVKYFVKAYQGTKVAGLVE